ncbi:DNA topoisomerase-3 [Gemmobacter caeni]|uniref:DNA topoisomerase n=1 Tax=Gemmobacter caeni TaxID=589035 RepID=A0A2T6B8N9_9RHOB|nr:DNA topoisomerase [Gemmobacter caeni]PTX52424.1 DNA topoisomerase-3 [Gemmobacter caeni]TWJ02905.1 DNA topoisomerase-3 [Gemmobacter caeni]
MGKSVVICEKPSQAKAIRAAVGNRYGEVLPARGHILTLKEPDDVRAEWKEWSATLLWPGKFYEKVPVPDARKFLNDIRAAATGADTIIIATDCDREGQLIGGEIVDYIGFRGVVKRAIFNAEDPKSLREAFERLHPNEKFHGLYMAGQAREQADQVTNLSLTRTATVTLKPPGQKGAIGIGRVKTPVLGIVCKREKEILDFKPRDLYEVDAEVRVAAGPLVLTCARLPASVVKEEEPEAEPDEELEADEEALEAADPLRGRILKREYADGLAQAAKGLTRPVSVKSEKKRQGPPRLFDLTALQAAASARFGWSGDKTLSTAQSLYATYTVITYPRGEAQYLPENNIADVPKLVSALTGLGPLRPHRALLAKPEVRKGKTGHFSDKALEGMSHYAIIPNANTAETFGEVIPRLPADEARLFDLIARQYLAALAPDFEYRQTTVEMTVPWKGHDWAFRASGRVPLILGWKEITGAAPLKTGEEEPLFPEIRPGESGKIVETTVRTLTTKAPARYTEGALIKVMKEAWRLVEDPEKRARLKDAKGIGTPATRGDVVKGLLTQGQIVAKGKTLQPSPGGMALYDLLMEIAPNVVDPARTAQWEMAFDFVEKGRMTAEDAVARILKDTEVEISRIASASGKQVAIGKGSKPTEKMIAAARMVAERKGIKLPPGVTTDSAKCRAFLDEHLGSRQAGEGGERPSSAPSEKQVALARSLAERTGAQIPEAALASARDLSSWIDAAMKKAPPRPPSEKQLAFAEKLAEEAGIDLPETARTDMTACSAFIDKNMGKGGSKGGAPKRATGVRR